MPELRTSTMTHLVWCPPAWRAKARATLAGLLERHPARTIFLIPCRRRPQQDRGVGGAEGLPAAGPLARGALRGDRAPPARHRGAPSRLDRAAAARLRPPRLLPLARRAGLGSNEFAEITGIADRLVVDSSEWRTAPAAYARLAPLFGRCRRLGHRLLADAPVAPPARRAVAGDRARSRSCASRGRGPMRSSSRAGCARASAATSR